MKAKWLFLYASFVVAVASHAAAQQASERYRGHFVYSWEGGGFFLPCGWDRNPRIEDLARVFFGHLRADSIRWPSGRKPFRSHEGETTFVVLRLPRPASSASDSAQWWLSADVDSMRRTSAADCRSRALPKLDKPRAVIDSFAAELGR